MKRVINFTKIRFVMFAISAVLIIGGLAGTFSLGGLNLGIDFQSGLSQRVQIAPVAMEVSYLGEEEARFNILDEEVSIDVFTNDGKTESYNYPLADYDTAAELSQAMMEVPSLTVNLVESDAPASAILSLAFLVDLSEGSAVVNYSNAGSGNSIEIDEIRNVLSNLGDPQIQVVGSEDAQEFLIRLEDDGTDEFSETASSQVFNQLEAKYGTGTVIIKQSDYVGPRFSTDLGQSVILLVGLALALILVYIWVRFELAYAVSAIIALAHDVALLIAFIGLTRMEVSTAIVAAVLTIIGYSLNDTIVVFDRIRENRQLMRDADLKTIVNTSITQSLSRTLITSVTTLLAVAAIYVFATGQIQDFALAMIVGVVIGTYSSIFIASPVLLGWITSRRSRKLAKDNLKYGSQTSGKKAEPKDDEQKEDTTAKVVEIPTVERKKKGKRKKK
ncbi:MAG: protein translocase subunit SecF [Spirochaetales bacterium]|uniref:Protein-export membrane protein SecF n=1 Tax=Candidatus Thalassospirochaeta sargassi TaxID=3119039 RepID=A0AAJ1IC69_9SPIO|nr:protein translocase subunit SecF [Spirochaetales bacterium]